MFAKILKSNAFHDKGGRFTSKDKATPDSPDAVLAALGGEHDMSTEEGVRSFIDAAAKALNVPAHLKVKTKFEDEGFELNGEACTYAGAYSPKVGSRPAEITMYPKGMDKAKIVEVMAHELNHHKFARFGSGEMLMDELSHDDLSKMQESGHKITPYAKDWWDAVKSGNAEVSQAVDETLAEMATLNGRSRRKAPKVWRDAYAKLHAKYEGTLS